MRKRRTIEPNYYCSSPEVCIQEVLATNDDDRITDRNSVVKLLNSGERLTYVVKADIQSIQTAKSNKFLSRPRKREYISTEETIAQIINPIKDYVETIKPPVIKTESINPVNINEIVQPILRAIEDAKPTPIEIPKPKLSKWFYCLLVSVVINAYLVVDNFNLGSGKPQETTIITEEVCDE